MFFLEIIIEAFKENDKTGKVKPLQVPQLKNGEQQSLQPCSSWSPCDCSV
jgi:hypothetical protein